MRLKKADDSDKYLLFKWANDQETRENSFQMKVILYDEHELWFDKCIKDNLIDIFLCYIEEEAIGQVRLNYRQDEAVINYSIAKEKRGLGYGVEMLRCIEQEIGHLHPDIKQLTALVKKENVKSQKIFEKLDYNRKLIEDGTICEYSKFIKQDK